MKRNMKLKFVFVLMTIVLAIVGCATKVEKHYSKVGLDKRIEEANVESKKCILTHVLEKCEKAVNSNIFNGIGCAVLGDSMIDVLNNAFIQCDLK